ncbi:hypothetical protein ACFOON_14490 [Novosphingobium piscinae]|uniref:Uncharacterized protein n=1 Tax=Novosphingobium piscinae TaxID=1507448 RepID=A0A7X1G0G3_9SPHN|nr:hypothetical protein [Novosphingobium piscinae]MBC2670345.1 hypothetical protein [Novosphingobium piscinae]
MNPVFAPMAASLLAPLLALLPVAVGTDAESAGIDQAAPSPGGEAAQLVGESEPPRPADRASLGFADVVRQQREAERAQQVRIEQRVIIRITPGPVSRPGVPFARDPRRGLFAEFAERQAPRFIERRTGQCVPVGGIAGVQADGPSRLILFMRDQRIISAALEKGCNARDYYSGFLVERTSDGMICAARDKLLSRTGANCSLGKLRQLVEIDPDD